MLDKEHNTLEGILKAVSLKYYINLGLSEKLKKAFPDVFEKELLNNRKLTHLINYNNIQN